MTFLVPLGLLALLTIPVVLLLHLIRERQRRVVVPSLLLWLHVPRKQDSRRARRLPLTLLLLLHLLIAGLLGLAIGRPEIFSGLASRADQLAIVVDTSTSVLARDGGQTRLAEAQDRARSLLRGMGPNGHATLIAAGPTPQVLASGGINDLPRLEAAVSGITAGGTGANLDDALVQAEAVLDLQRPASIVVLTDGAASTSQRTMAASVDWLVVGSAQPNRAILNFAARQQGTTTQLYARVANYDSAPWSGVARLYDGDQRVDTSDISIPANSETEVTWKIAPQSGALRVELDGQDSLPEDDQAYANVMTTRPLNILLVSATPEPLRRALAAVPGAKVVVIAPEQYDASNQTPADLTVFDGTLPAAWPNGGVLVVNPPEGSALLPVNGAVPTERQTLSQHGVTTAGLNFDSVSFGLVKQLTTPNWVQVELASGDTPLMLRGKTGGHDVVIWTFALQNGNLPNRLAFPLLVARTVRTLTPASLPETVQAGAPLRLHPSPRTTTVQITAPDGRAQQMASAPELTLHTLTQPGWYELAEQGPGGTIFQGRVGVSAGSVIESDLRVQTTPALQSASTVSADAAKRLTTELWPWLALAALLVLTLEWGYVHVRKA